MADIGEQSDLLRALGPMLDGFHAREIDIAFHERFLSVCWKGFTRGAGQQSFEDVELDSLREQARQLRSGLLTNPVPGQLAELLRTLGQELGTENLEATSVSPKGTVDSSVIWASAAPGPRW